MSRLTAPPPLALARIVLGCVWAAHWLGQLPYAATLYARGGIVARATDNPVPMPWLDRFDTPFAAIALVATMVALSVAHAAGLFARATGVALWAGGALLLFRNQLTLNPSLAYLGLFWLAHAAARPNPPWSVDRWLAARRGVTVPREADRLPTDVLAVVTMVGALGYSFSAWTKLASPSWRSGDALHVLLAGPLGRDNFLVRGLLAAPAWTGSFATWGVIAVEGAALPLALLRRGRPWAWLALTLLHLGLLVTVDLADISLAMLAFHAVTFDPCWVGIARPCRSSPGDDLARPPAGATQTLW